MSLERINLNVEKETRKRLRAVAKRLKRTESDVARELLTHALDRAEREALFRDVAVAMTARVRKRMLEVARGLERLDE